ncbi:MAG: hypothetical protein AAFN41_13705, partial [Planctomycetota bacterium]
IGALAHSQAEKLRGGPAPAAVDADAIRAAAEAVPGWLDRATAGPRNYMRLAALTNDPILPATGETVLTIEMRNLLPKPIAVGGNRPVGTRMAISPRLDVASHLLRGRVDPEVVDAHRKLRLEPGEATRIDVWPDAGMMGLISEIKAGHRVRARFNVLQNFVINNGPFQRGPLSLNAESPLVTKTPLAETIIPADQLVRYVETAEGANLLALLPACRAALIDVDFPSGTLTGTDAASIARVLADRYPRLDRSIRAAIIAIMPPSTARSEMRVLDQALVAESDPALLRFALLTRAVNANLPELVAATASSDPDHAWFAGYVSERLGREDITGYAVLLPPPSHLPAAESNDETSR